MKKLIIIPILFLAFLSKAQSKIEARIRHLAGEYNKNAPLIRVNNLDSVEKKMLKKNLSVSRGSYSYSEDENSGAWGGNRTLIRDHRKPFIYYKINTDALGGTSIEILSGSDAL